MAVYNSMGALASRGVTAGAPAKRSIMQRRSAVPARTATTRAAIARPISSNTGLPGALAPPAKESSTAGRTLGKRRKAAPGASSAPAPVAPVAATSASRGAAVASDYGWREDSEVFVPVEPSGGGGGGGGAVRPASEVVIDPPEETPKDGIPKWAAFAGIAACVVVGAIVLHNRGVI
jgi:hypothetical protein